MQQLVEYLDSLQGSNYQEAVNQVRDVFLDMQQERRGYITPSHMEIAKEQPPPIVNNSGGVAEGQQVQQTGQSVNQKSTVLQNDDINRTQFKQQQEQQQMRPFNQQMQQVRQTRSKTYRQQQAALEEVTSQLVSSGCKKPAPRKVQPTRKVNEGKVDCICRDRGAVVPQNDMVSCADCGVSQHRRCVAGTTDNTNKPRLHHYCEWCRAKWADPFWKRVAKFKGGKSFRICGEAGKYSSRLDQPLEIEEKGSNKGRGYELRMACLQLGDSVDFRFQWPPKAKLEFNGHVMEIYKGRSSSSVLGCNHRDKSISVEVLAKRGRNFLKFAMDDPSAYCLVFFMAQKQGMQEVKGMMAPAETLPEAVQRIKRTFVESSGGINIEKEIVSLNCVMGSCRVQKPVRFKDSSVFRVFDLNTFLQTCERSLKWQCLYTMKHSRVCNLQVDSYMEEVLRVLGDRNDVDQIEINMDGKWRINENCPWQDVLLKGQQLSFNMDGCNKRRRQQLDSVEDDDDSYDDEADLRETVAQLAKRSRKCQEVKQPEVISLLDDDDQGQNTTPSNFIDLV
eukprot:TRINITY_DN34684_c0_g1_i1.p1 TRINITY_DN34684_c0_g1~~TRINITY_DN34684_c0_g1_i1.p1  ORF type:complete len:561 (+),score=99.14 TRINITY_DN34684_c0_g1_i1:176-1858(+)